MGSGPLARKKHNLQVQEKDTSGKTGNKSPYSSRVITGLPLRVSAQQTSPAPPAPQPATKTKGMAGKDEVFGKTCNIFLVLGASVSA